MTLTLMYREKLIYYKTKQLLIALARLKKLILKDLEMKELNNSKK